MSAWNPTLGRDGEAAGELERFLGHLTDSLPDAVLVVEMPGKRVTYANRAIADLLGYSAEEVTGRSVRILFRDQSAHLSFERKLLQAFAEGRGRLRREQALARKSGELVWTEIVASFIREGEKLRQVISLIRNVTDRRLAEEALTQSHARLQLLNNISGGITTGMSVNEVIRLTLEELAGHFSDLRVAYSSVDNEGNLTVSHSLDPPGMPSLAGQSANLTLAPEYLRALRRGKAVIVEDVAADPRLGGLAELLLKAGARAILDIPLQHSNGLAGILCFDSPEPRKWNKYETATLTDVAGYLSIALGDAYAELERQRLQDQLRQSQKMEAIGQLAGGVAHDFNNLLTGIGGYTQLALSQVDAPPLRADLEKVKEYSDRAARLTQQLLAFSRRQPLEPIVLNLNKLIEGTTGMLVPLIGEDIELQFVPAAELGNVRADPGQIEQVLMNLAVNSRDAMSEGGKLIIETANVTLSQSYANEHTAVLPGAYVMLAVSDTGYGMDAATVEKVFEPFFTTKERGKGTGLGLSTVYGIVKQHDGNIWAYSEPTLGTTFKIYLPRVDYEVDTRKATDASDVVPRGSETILLVEDEHGVRDVVERTLRAHGYRVLSATSPGGAEELFASYSREVELLLTDVVMPGCDGRRLYERLLETKPELRVLYMSGYTDKAILQNRVLRPGIPFLQKPFDPCQLARKVRGVLDGLE